MRKGLESCMAHAGLLVFREQGFPLSGDEQVRISSLFGAGEMESTHGVHKKADNEHIFRLSNDDDEGIVGPGAEWHCDGSFTEDVFSHAGYHIVEIPENASAGTSFSHLGVVHDLLDPQELSVLERMATVNSNSGVLHPIVFTHPMSKRRSVFFHLAMSGAVVHVSESGQRTALSKDEMASLLNRLSDLYNHSRSALHHKYEAGDLVMIDNWAVAHRAQDGSFSRRDGLRVVHRTTVKGNYKLSAGNLSLPESLPQGKGTPPTWFPPEAVWVEGYVGFRWRPCEPKDTSGGRRSLGQVQMQTPCWDSSKQFSNPVPSRDAWTYRFARDEL